MENSERPERRPHEGPELPDPRAPRHQPRKPNRYQHEPDGNSMWERASSLGTIAPVQGDPTLDPADNPWEVSMMAGWGDPEGRGRGHDALQGMGDMLLGNADATEGLAIEGDDPLTLEPGESLDNRRQVANGLRCQPRQDWCSHL